MGTHCIVERLEIPLSCCYIILNRWLRDHVTKINHHVYIPTRKTRGYRSHGFPFYGHRNHIPCFYLYAIGQNLITWEHICGGLKDCLYFQWLGFQITICRNITKEEEWRYWGILTNLYHLEVPPNSSMGSTEGEWKWTLRGDFVGYCENDSGLIGLFPWLLTCY